MSAITKNKAGVWATFVTACSMFAASVIPSSSADLPTHKAPPAPMPAAAVDDLLRGAVNGAIVGISSGISVGYMANKMIVNQNGYTLTYLNCTCGNEWSLGANSSIYTSSKSNGQNITKGGIFGGLSGIVFGTGFEAIGFRMDPFRYGWPTPIEFGKSVAANVVTGVGSAVVVGLTVKGQQINNYYNTAWTITSQGASSYDHTFGSYPTQFNVPLRTQIAAGALNGLTKSILNIAFHF